MIHRPDGRQIKRSAGFLQRWLVVTPAGESTADAVGGRTVDPWDEAMETCVKEPKIRHAGASSSLPESRGGAGTKPF